MANPGERVTGVNCTWDRWWSPWPSLYEDLRVGALLRGAPAPLQAVLSRKRLSMC